MKQIGIVVGVNGKGKDAVYRVVVAQIQPKQGTKMYDWRLNNFQVKYSDLVLSIVQNKNNISHWVNVTVDKNTGKIVGTCGDLERLNKTNGSMPLVIISELKTAEGRTVGYRIADFEGKVRMVKLQELLIHGEKVTAAGGIPVQNAIFNKATKDKKAFFKAFKENQYIVEVMPVAKKNEFADRRKVAIVETEETKEIIKNIDNKEKLKAKFNPVQIKELQKAKKLGLDMKVVANPKLDESQINVLRKAMQSGVDVSRFSSPEYPANCMNKYVLDILSDKDISEYLNPKYSLKHLNELSRAIEIGISIEDISDPDMPIEEVEQIASDLEFKMYNKDCGGIVDMEFLI